MTTGNKLKVTYEDYKNGDADYKRGYNAGLRVRSKEDEVIIRHYKWVVEQFKKALREAMK